MYKLFILGIRREITSKRASSAISYAGTDDETILQIPPISTLPMSSRSFRHPSRISYYEYEDPAIYGYDAAVLVSDGLDATY